MNDLKTLTAQPQPLIVDGETYMVHPFDMNDWGALQAWIDKQHADPFDIVSAAIKKGEFTITMQQYMIDKAMEKAMKPRCPLGSPEADELVMSMAGQKQLLYLSIRKGRPDFTEEQAGDLVVKLTAVDTAKLGQLSTINMVVSDPKDEPLDVRPPSRTSGPAASRKRKKAADRIGG